jgi:peptidoglycan/xylan/chitin deacetylase (PgdA/CDA1 family)
MLHRLVNLLRRGRRVLQGPQPAILMYHRIAEPAYDPWGLCVSPNRFAEHLRLLKRVRDVLPMDEFAARLKTGTLSRRAAAITFDDGYLDNLTAAAPLLKEASLPATLFVTTGTLGQSCPFWWDELAHLTLGRMKAIDGNIKVGNASVPVRFDAVSDPAQLKSDWRGWKKTATGRESAYFELWNRLRLLDSSERRHAMAAIRSALGERSGGQNDPTMTVAQLGELTAQGSFQLGGHTRTHPPLTTISPDERRDEIVVGRQDCMQWTGASMTGFAYPHGDLDEETRKIVREAGFSWACTTEPVTVKSSAFDLFALPRLQILNVSAAQLWLQMRMAAMR